MTRLLQDVRYALRLFARSPGFTLTAVVVLAVGIGLNAAVFSVFNALLLKPIGGPSDGVLATLVRSDPTQPRIPQSFSYSDYQALRQAPAVYSRLLAQRLENVGITEDGATRRAFIAAVSSNYFATLATQPVLGRHFLPSEEASPSAGVTIVSHAYWQKRGMDRGILGRTVRINGADFTVVGVMPEGFSGTTAVFSPEAWVPLGALAATAPDGQKPVADLQLVARLKPSLTIEGAQTLLAPLASRLVEQGADAQRKVRLTAYATSRLSVSPNGQTDGEANGLMLFLLAMSAVVLFIATLNLANMLLARGAVRQREVGVRLALGARPSQVLRQLLTEALLLSAAGAVLGLGLATTLVHLLVARMAYALPFVLAYDAWPDHRVVLATAAFSLVSAIVFGLGPAVRLVRADLLTPLSPSATVPAGGRFRFRNLLVASQLAMSLALLTAGGLFVHGAWRATSAEPGFALERGIIATLDPSLAGYNERVGRERYGRVLERLRAMPGVESASFASLVPFGVASEVRSFRRAGVQAADREQWGSFTVVGSEYFRTLGMRVLRGREFTAAEEQSAGTRRVAVVDETLARRLWAGVDPLGQFVQVSDDSTTWEAPLEVVGVVPAVRNGMFDTQPEPHVYVPFGAAYRSEMNVHARLRSGAPAVAGEVMQQLRRELAAIDARLPVLSVRTLEQHRDNSLYMWVARATANLFSAFALAALGLAMLGVYGVKAFLVARRTREIGIRVALGAGRSDIVRLVVGDSLLQVGGALAVGLGLSLLLTRVLASWVYGLGHADLAVPLVAATLLAACGLGASYVAVRRAMNVAPSVALRSE